MWNNHNPTNPLQTYEITTNVPYTYQVFCTCWSHIYIHVQTHYRYTKPSQKYVLVMVSYVCDGFVCLWWFRMCVMVLYIYTDGFIYSCRFTQTAPLSLCICVTHLYTRTKTSRTYEPIPNTRTHHKHTIHAPLSSYIFVTYLYTYTKPPHAYESITEMRAYHPRSKRSQTYHACAAFFAISADLNFFSCRLAHRKVQRFSLVSRGYARKYIHAYMHILIYVCIYIYIYVHVFIYIFIYLYVHNAYMEGKNTIYEKKMYLHDTLNAFKHTHTHTLAQTHIYTQYRFVRCSLPRVPRISLVTCKLAM